MPVFIMFMTACILPMYTHTVSDVFNSKDLWLLRQCQNFDIGWENIIDSVPYTLSISIYQFLVVKTMTELTNINPLTAKLFKLNFHPLEVGSG